VFRTSGPTPDPELPTLDIATNNLIPFPFDGQPNLSVSRPANFAADYETHSPQVAVLGDQ
jgi:hypothetical protein